MKQIIRNILFLSLMLLSSCELSMEEYVVTEDQRGKDEPYTEVNEYGEFTYEYNENVTPLNGDPQNFIATMNDSVIWFMDNMPKKWVPKAGEYIAANCSKTIPLGLCAKVRSVTRENGMIRVEHEPATRDEVFKQLEVRIDFDYVLPGVTDFEDDEGDDEEDDEDSTAVTRSTQTFNRPGFWKNDTTFVDMSLFEPETRANSKEKDTTVFQFMKSIPLGSADKITSDGKTYGELYVDITYKSYETVKMHHYENKEADYIEEWNESYSDRDIRTLVGFGNNSESATKELANFPKRPKDYNLIKKLLNTKSILKYIKRNASVKDKNISVPIPSSPISAIFRFNASVGYTVMGYGIIECKLRSATEKVGYTMRKGKKKKIDETNNKTRSFKITNIQFGGSADVWLRLRGGVGVVVGAAGAGVGAVVGLEGKGGLRAVLETEQLSDCELVDNQNFNAGYYYSVGGFLEGIIKFGPWTISVGDLNFMVHDFPKYYNMKAEVDMEKTHTELVSDKVKFPVKDSNGNPVIGMDGEPVYETRDEYCIATSLCFKKLETFYCYGVFKKINQRPALRIYDGTEELGHRKCHQVIIDKELKANKTYDFKVNLLEAGLSDENNQFQIVPCIYDVASGIITEYRGNIMIATPGTPYIKEPKLYQWYGRYLTEDDWAYYLEEYGEDYFKGKTRFDFAEYGFTTVVELKNTTRIKEWGLLFEMYNYKGKKIFTKEIPYPFKGICPSGKFTYITTFISEEKTTYNNGTTGLRVYATPYAKYDSSEKKYYHKHGLTFVYPYEREGGYYSAGQSQVIDF